MGAIISNNTIDRGLIFPKAEVAKYSKGGNSIKITNAPLCGETLAVTYDGRLFDNYTKLKINIDQAFFYKDESIEITTDSSHLVTEVCGSDENRDKNNLFTASCSSSVLYKGKLPAVDELALESILEMYAQEPNYSKKAFIYSLYKRAVSIAIKNTAISDKDSFMLRINELEKKNRNLELTPYGY